MVYLHAFHLSLILASITDAVNNITLVTIPVSRQISAISIVIVL